MNYLFSVLLIIAVFFVGRYLFKKIKILDRPGADLKGVRGPVPTLMGIFAYISFVLTMIWFFPGTSSNNMLRGLVLGVLPILIVELIEELGYMGKVKFRIPSIVRLVSHIGGAIIAVYVGKIGVGQELILGSFVRHIPQYVFVVFFVVRAMLCINAINWIDGINAQASGVSAIGFLTIFLLIKFVVMRYYTEFNNRDILVLTSNMSLVLFFISLVSTVLEYKPLGLLRDVGIMFFGFSLAYLSVLGGAKIGTLVVALSLVIFDAIWVGLYRILILKKNPMKGDYTHIHHRLLGLKWTRPEVRAFVWIWSFVMMVLMLMQSANRLNKIIIFVMMAVIFFGVNYYLFIVKKLKCGLNLKKD
ncbi:MAG TPA: hypothetical protein PK674_01145 [Candidatus Absconditabacterales bacterium]|nr:hypothetical protein [Candidatus Absconditabacterales bacterium]